MVSKCYSVAHFFQVFVGLGEPYEGPGPLDALANGCFFINPKVGLELLGIFIGLDGLRAKTKTFTADVITQIKLTSIGNHIKANEFRDLWAQMMF